MTEKTLKTILLFSAFLLMPMNSYATEQDIKISGNTSKIMQLIDRRLLSIENQSVYIEGDYNLVVQIIGDIPQELLEEFLIDASDRQELAKHLGLAETALDTFLESTLLKKIPQSEWSTSLAEVANRYHALRKDIERYDGTDQETIRYKDMAKRALSVLDWEAADNYLAKVVIIQLRTSNELSEKLEKSKLNAAETTAQRAEVVMIDFQRELAASRYQEAANLVPDSFLDKKVKYLEESAILYMALGNHDLAENIYQEILLIYKELHGENHTGTINTLTNLAFVTFSLHQYQEASKYYEDSLSLARATHADYSEQLLVVLSSLSNIDISQERYEKAEELLTEAQEILENNSEISIVRNIGVHFQLSTLYKRQKKHDKSLENYLDIIPMLEQDPVRNFRSITTTKSNLAGLYRDRGEHRKSLALFTEVYDAFSEAYGVDSLEMYWAALNLGIVYRDTNQISETEKYYLEALSVAESEKNDHLTFNTLMHLAQLYVELKKKENIEKTLQKALGVRSNIGNLVDPNTELWIHNVLGDLYATQSKYPQAEKHFKSAYSLRKEIVGPTEMAKITAKTPLINLYLLIDKYEEAEVLLLNSVDIVEREIGDINPFAGELANKLGILYTHKKDYVQADKFYVKAMDIFREIFGINSSDFQTTLRNFQSMSSLIQDN